MGDTESTVYVLTMVSYLSNPIVGSVEWIGHGTHVGYHNRYQ